MTLYAVSGLDLTPSYLWLDEQQRVFASVLGCTRTPARFIAVAGNTATLDLGSLAVRKFIRLPRDRKVVVEPTVSTFEDMFHIEPGR